MKIYEGQRILIDQQKTISSKKTKETESFQQVMDKVTDNSAVSRKLPESINPVQIIDGIIGAVPVEESSTVSAEKGILLDSLKDALDLVDFYAGKLADRNFPADNLSSLVDQLQEKLESIENFSSEESVPENLKPIMSDLTLTIGTEIARYRRGDYL